MLFWATQTIQPHSLNATTISLNWIDVSRCVALGIIVHSLGEMLPFSVSG